MKVGSFTLLNTSISFLSSTITSRLLSPSEFGTVALISVFSGFIAFFKDSGISYLVIRENYSESETNQLHAFTAAFGFVLFLFLAVISYPIAWFYNDSKLFLPTIAIAFVLFLESLSIVPLALLRKQFLFSKTGSIQTSGLVVSILVTIVSAYAGLSYWSLIFGQWAGAIVQYLVAMQSVELEFNQEHLASVPAVFKKIRPMFGSIVGTRMLTYWSSNADNLMIGKLYGSFDLGLYARAYQFLNMQMNLIAGTFNSTLLPSLKGLDTEVSRKNEYGEVLNFMTIVIFPIMVVLVFFSRQFVGVLWGEGWMRVAEISPYFGIMAMGYVPISTFGSVYVANKKEGLLFRSGLITSVATVLIIVIAVFFTLKTFVFLFTSGYVTIVSGIHLWYALKAGVLSRQYIARVWIPKTLFSLSLLVAIYYSYETIKVVTVITFFIFSAFVVQTQLKKAYALIMKLKV
jgi:teichuronic acid exporter